MERLFIDLIAALGINTNTALILGALIISNGYLLAQVIDVRQYINYCNRICGAGRLKHDNHTDDYG